MVASAFCQWSNSNCSEVDICDGCDYDDFATNDVIATFDSESGRWELAEDFHHYGQSVEIMDALMAAGIIEKDDDHDNRFDTVTTKIAEHIHNQTVETHLMTCRPRFS